MKNDERDLLIICNSHFNSAFNRPIAEELPEVDTVYETNNEDIMGPMYWVLVDIKYWVIEYSRSIYNLPQLSELKALSFPR